MIELEHPALSIERQCALLGLGRSSLYYRPCGESAENLRLMRLLDEEYTRHPFYGVRRMTEWLCRAGEVVNRKRVRRLMRRMGLEAIYPKRRLSVPGEGHKRYPYLLRGVAVERPDQVWSSDITYIRLHSGFAYLVAVLDWYSRYVLSWALSVDLTTEFCVQALEEALQGGRPEIFNTDQGVQFTSDAFTSRLAAEGIGISMDGRGRVFDNIFIERLWRTVKTEEVYLKDYVDPKAARQSLGEYLGFYNQERLHQALGYCPPAQVYHEGTERKRGCATARAVGGTPVALRAPSVPPTAN
jgi:putative transposase